MTVCVCARACVFLRHMHQLLSNATTDSVDFSKLFMTFRCIHVTSDSLTYAWCAFAGISSLILLMSGAEGIGHGISLLEVSLQTLVRSRAVRQPAVIESSIGPAHNWPSIGQDMGGFGKRICS